MSVTGVLVLIFAFGTGVFVLVGDVVGAVICVVLCVLFAAALLIGTLMGVAT